MSEIVAGAPIEAREERLAQGADTIAEKRTSVVGGRNVLVIASGVLVTVGLTAIVLAWVGAAHSTLVEEQVPYLISGGLLGLALAIVGAVTYFAHWLTVLIREAREHEVTRRQDHVELMQALRSLANVLEQQEDRPNGRAGSPRAQRPLRQPSRRS
jgi:Na+/melibiose symporter-like transporter